jgi:predicted permease
VAAVPLARLAVAALLSIQPATPIPVILDVPLDARVLAFTVAVAALSVLLFALAPALKVSAQDPAAALRPSAGAVRSRTRLRNGLVIAQVAGSTLLLGVSAMLIGALGRAGSIPLGFDPRAVFAFDTDLSLAGYTGEAADLFADRLLERVGELPQLESVALGAMLPLDMESMGFGPITVPGAKTASGEPASFDASVNVVSPAWFATLRIPVRGRVFDAGDRAGAERVAILNRTAARRFFGLGLAGGDEGQAIGRSFEIEADAGGFESYRVVGVSDDGKYKWLGEGTEAHVYFSLPQHRRGELHLVARARSGATDGAAATLAAREVRALDPNVALAGPRWLEAIAQTSSLPQRIGASVASGMGTLGLALAAIGLYGALALRVGERRREIGVRLALGAAPRQVGRWVAREGVRLTLVGLAVGTALTVAVGFLMRGLLYGSSPLSPATLAAAPLILATIALLAAIGPIRQAVRVDPSTTLRSE